ncbi:hypothetical protein DXG03_001892, partial [Asterophora parasitica]
MNDTTTSTFPKSWACHLRMLQACFKVWTKDLMTGGPKTLANNAMDLYHMWVAWNDRPDELHRLNNAIWEEEVDAVQRVSKWLDQTGWLVTFVPCWCHVDRWVWLCIEAKNGFAQAGELFLPAIDVSEPAPASSTTPAPSSRQPTPTLEVTPSVMEAGSSEERHNEDSGAVASAAGVQDDNVEMAGLGVGTGNGGVIPGVESGAVTSDKDSRMTNVDLGLARNTGVVEESDALPLAPRLCPWLPLMGTQLMLPSGWQEWARVEAKAKGTGNAVASSSGSGHWPQTLVGVVIDQKHTAANKMGETVVGPTTDKHHQMNAFGVDGKSTGEVEVEVLSKAVVEDSESDGSVEVVLGPSKAVEADNPATFSFLASNREKSDTVLTWAAAVARMQKDSTDVPPVPAAVKREVGPHASSGTTFFGNIVIMQLLVQCMYQNMLQATSALGCWAANTCGDLWALKALYATLRLQEKEALAHVSEMEAVLGWFADMMESERDEGM